jgi:hypothetical protein
MSKRRRHKRGGRGRGRNHQKLITPTNREIERYTGVDLDSPVQEALAIKAGKTHPTQSSGTTYTSQSTHGTTWTKTYCKHWREPVELLNNVQVHASAWFDRPKWNEPDDDSHIDMGFYLDQSWADYRIVVAPGVSVPWLTQGPGKYVVYHWMDRNVSPFAEVWQTYEAIKWLLAIATDDKFVDIGCQGGHGRTGTVIAGMLVLQGMTADAAINYVHTKYCEEAIESSSQEHFIHNMELMFKGEEPVAYVAPPVTYTTGAYSTGHKDCICGHGWTKHTVKSIDTDMKEKCRECVCLDYTEDQPFDANKPLKCMNCGHVTYPGGIHYKGDPCIWRDCNCVVFDPEVEEPVASYKDPTHCECTHSNLSHSTIGLKPCKAWNQNQMCRCFEFKPPKTQEVMCANSYCQHRASQHYKNSDETGRACKVWVQAQGQICKC